MLLHHVVLAAQGAADASGLQGSITNLFDNLRDIGTKAGIAVCAFFLMWSGFIWMSAGGNVRQMESAKQALFNALAGLAIILAANALAMAIQAAIGNAPS